MALSAKSPCLNNIVPERKPEGNGLGDCEPPKIELSCPNWIWIVKGFDNKLVSKDFFWKRPQDDENGKGIKMSATSSKSGSLSGSPVVGLSLVTGPRYSSPPSLQNLDRFS